MPGSRQVVDDTTALLEEVAWLRQRVAQLEAERDEYLQQTSERFVLQQVFSTMNSTLEIDEILATVLRGVCETLRFRRVVLFDVPGPGRATRRLETDQLGAVIPSPRPDDLRMTRVFAAMVAGRMDFTLGIAGDGEHPLADTLGTYCLLPLISRNIVRGVLYVDNPPRSEITETQLRTLLDFAAQAAIALENARLHDETRRLLEETQRLALTDPLTGLFNRRALGELLARELTNAERYGAPLAFLILDLDDLKKINDSLGHAAGDDALKRFARIAKSEGRRGDIVARFGGDEFVLVLSQTDRHHAELAVRRLFERLHEAGLRCSIGVAMFPDDSRDAAGLLGAADEALYRAKQSGKDSCAFFRSPRARET